MFSPRVLVMEKFNLVAEAFKSLIEKDLDLRVIGTVGDSDSLFEAVRAGKPDIALLSIYRPFRDGLEAGRLLKAACSTVKIIVLTTR